MLEFGIVRLAKTSFSREQRSLMSTSTSSRTFAHKSGNYRVNSVACATQLVTPGPTNLAKEATNEVEEESEVHEGLPGGAAQTAIERKVSKQDKFSGKRPHAETGLSRWVPRDVCDLKPLEPSRWHTEASYLVG